MKITIITPTGHAVLNNTHTKAGYKALWQYIKHAQLQHKPFLVLPNGTLAHDLAEATSVDNMPI